MRKLVSVFFMLGIFSSTSFANISSQGENIAGEIEELGQRVDQVYVEAAELIVEFYDLAGRGKVILIGGSADEMASDDAKSLAEAYVFDQRYPLISENDQINALREQIKEKLEQIGKLDDRRAELVLDFIGAQEISPDQGDSVTKVPSEQTQELLDQIEKVEKSLNWSRNLRGGSGTAVLTSIVIGVVGVGGWDQGRNVMRAKTIVAIMSFTSVVGVIGWLYGQIRVHRANSKLLELRERLQEN